MWISYGIQELNTCNQQIQAGLTIGAFDGVHRGHQALIRWLVKGAHSAGVQALVLTFDPLPQQVLRPEQKGVLSSLQERIDLIASLGVDGIIVIPFSRETAAIPARDFIMRLVHHLHLHGLWVGPDFALGQAREGNIDFLRRMGKQQGFDVHVFEDVVLWEGEPVRSSRIRYALEVGALDEANGCLGRPYRISGTVNHGDKRGHNLGFPTANLKFPEGRMLPANGVYICRVYLEHCSFEAITNVGTRPTFNNGRPTIEAHILDFDANIYHKMIKVDFLHRLRPELKFDSPEALVAQMHQDKIAARAWLAKTEQNSMATPAATKLLGA